MRAPRLLKLFTDLLSDSQRPIGLLLREVGNMSDLLNNDAKDTLRELMTNAFKDACATEQGDPQFFWDEGETLAVFKAGVQVCALKPFTKIPISRAVRTAR